ncbi:MAG TPA: hypothetical protein VFU01_16500 [Gemmatimonadaceae bacterium]|nr:hypothetical protein [Gemmatimonadaceae bacterium]
MNDAEPTIVEHHLPVTRTARYYTLGETSSPPASDMWVVCHGFAQLARAFIEEFRPLVRPGRLIVAPEALNRFYLNREGGRAGASARVGATWMTREDRLAEIDDYVRYLDELLLEVGGERRDGVRVTALGYSQGTATVARWLVQGKSKIDRVILWAGLLPPEIDPAGAARERLSTTQLHFVRGTKDEMVSSVSLSEQRESVARIGINVHAMEFEGGHRLDRDTLLKLGG